MRHGAASCVEISSEHRRRHSVRRHLRHSIGLSNVDNVVRLCIVAPARTHARAARWHVAEYVAEAAFLNSNLGRGLPRGVAFC